MFGRVSIRTQVVALLVISQVMAVATLILLVRPAVDNERRPLPIVIAESGLAPLITLIGVIEELPDSYIDMVIAAALHHELDLKLVDVFETRSEAQLRLPAFAGLRALRDTFPMIEAERLAVARRPGAGWNPLNLVRYEAGYQLSDGRWIVFAPPDDSIARSFPPMILFTIIALSVLPVAAALIWAGITLVNPVMRLAKRAETFGSQLNVEPIELQGPREVRVLADALNDMYARLRQLVDARSLSLAAIGHDLRTPLTRMRLRVELLDDDEIKTALLRDTANLTRMLDAALTYIRDQSSERTVILFDLPALLHTVADEVDLSGQRIDVRAPNRLVIQGAPDQMARAVRNLLENALQHGSKVDIVLQHDMGTLTLTISDDGTGIPVQERARLLRPFERGDQSRAESAVQNFGLGLSIANDIIVKHGGTLSMTNNSPAGLKVIIILPHESTRHWLQKIEAGTDHNTSED